MLTSYRDYTAAAVQTVHRPDSAAGLGRSRRLPADGYDLVVLLVHEVGRHDAKQATARDGDVHSVSPEDWGQRVGFISRLLADEDEQRLMLMMHYHQFFDATIV